MIGLPALAVDPSTSPQFFRSKDTHQLMVSTKDCKSAQEIVKALAQWKNNLGEVVPQSGAKEIKGTNSCSVSIDDYAPQFVKDYQGLHPEVDWGNCWGVALAASGMIPYFTQTIGSGEDIPSWMDPNRCKPVSMKDVSPGDIGAVRSTSGSRTDLHGFVYVSPGIVFSKNSLKAKDGFELQTFSQMFKGAIDSPNATCFGLEKNEKVNGCPEYIQYYHCISYQELEKKAGTVSDVYRAYDEKMRNAEQTMVKKAMTCKDDIEKIQSSLRPLVDTVYNAAMHKMNEPGLSPSEKLMWKALQLRAASLEGYF